MAIYGYHDNKESVMKRLKRAEGQVRGVAKMVNEDTYCIDILTQISAVQSALDKVSLELIGEHAKYCLSNTKIDQSERDAKSKELVSAISRMLPR